MGCDWYTFYSAYAIGVVFQGDYEEQELWDIIETLDQCSLYKAGVVRRRYDDPEDHYVLIISSSLLTARKISVPGPYNIEGEEALVKTYSYNPTEDEVAILTAAYSSLKPNEKLPPCKRLLLSASNSEALEIFDTDSEKLCFRKIKRI